RNYIKIHVGFSNLVPKMTQSPWIFLSNLLNLAESFAILCAFGYGHFHHSVKILKKSGVNQEWVISVLQA
ncbi:MAG: hypothetical protein ACPHCL_02985, partial [Candidatus Puniceispirillaceae bacterium]